MARLITLGGTLGRRWSPLVAGDAATLCVAGVTLGDIYLRFARQACYRLHLVARLVALGRRWSALVAGDAAALCKAGMALGDIYLRFAWQACYRLHLVARLVAVGRRGTMVTCDPIIRSLVTLFYPVTCDPIIRSPATLSL